VVSAAGVVTGAVSTGESLPVLGLSSLAGDFLFEALVSLLAFRTICKMARNTKVANTKKIQKASKDTSASKRKSPAKEEKTSTGKDSPVDTAPVTTPAADTTSSPPPAAQTSAQKKSPVRRTRTMAETVKEGKKLIKSVRGKRTRNAGVVTKKAEAPKKAAKPAPKPKAVKKVDNTKKIKRTRTMAATIKESKKLTAGLKKRR